MVAHIALVELRIVMIPTSHHTLLRIIRTILVDRVYSLIRTTTAICKITATDHILQAGSQADGSFVSVCLVYPEDHRVIDGIEGCRSQAHRVSPISVDPYNCCL